MHSFDRLCIFFRPTWKSSGAEKIEDKEILKAGEY